VQENTAVFAPKYNYNPIVSPSIATYSKDNSCGKTSGASPTLSNVSPLKSPDSHDQPEKKIVNDVLGIRPQNLSLA